MNKTIVLLWSLMPLFAHAQDAYLCVPLKSTGFKYDKGTKRWEQVTFKTSEKKYLLKKVKGQWEWRLFGEELGEKCGLMYDSGWVKCIAPWITIKFNKNNLRYIESYVVGYLEGDDAGDTPSITIGSCTSI